jgi:hypothetical protein
MTPNIRKTAIVKEVTHAEGGRNVSPAITRVAAIAVIENPYAGRFVEDLSPLFDVGEALGDSLMAEAAALLAGAPRSYGKAALVGTNGEREHGGALIHPKLGKPMRAAIGGGEAVIPSNAKVCAAGATIDVSIGNKDDVWSFDDFDTMTVSVADAPGPDEIVVVMVVTDGGRPHARLGKGRATV